MINLDTHILIFALAGHLRRRERELLEHDRWAISCIVLWEIGKLVQLGRLNMDLGDRAVRRAIGTLHVLPIDLEVADQSTRLDFIGDPADELIAATSVVHDIPLLTRDKRIRRSRIVPLA